MRWNRVQATMLMFALSIASCGGEQQAAQGLDADTEVTGNALSSSCTGVVPSPGSPVEAIVGQDPWGGCLGAVADGAGHWFAGGWDGAGVYFTSWYLLPASGGVYSAPLAFAAGGATILPQSSGLLVLDYREWCNDYVPPPRVCQQRVLLDARSGSGALSHETVLVNLTNPTGIFPDGAWSAAGDPAGGAMTAHASTPGDGTWHLYAQRFTSGAVAKAGLKQLAVSSNLATKPLATMSAVTSSGYGFVAWDSGAGGARGVWTDASGNPRGGTFALPGHWENAGANQVAALLDGSVVVELGGQWVASIAPLAQSYRAAPSWLSTRPNTTLHTVRGGKAYAVVFPVAKNGPQSVALFAPAGNRCGAVSLNDPSSGQPFEIDVGADGSVIVAADGGNNAGGTNDGTCRYLRYPALLH